MKKTAEKLKKGDKIKIGDEVGIIVNIEFSDIGKHGKRKCRIEAKFGDKKIVIIRPSDFVFDVL